MTVSYCRVVNIVHLAVRRLQWAQAHLVSFDRGLPLQSARVGMVEVTAYVVDAIVYSPCRICFACLC